MTRCKYCPGTESRVKVTPSEKRFSIMIVAMRHCCIIESEQGAFLQILVGKNLILETIRDLP